jgi:hypothetical protein
MMKLSDLKVPADAKVNEHLSELLRKAYSGEDTHQAEKVEFLATQLSEKAKEAGKTNNFDLLRSAVMTFITLMDGTVADSDETCIGVLGDMELAVLFWDFLKRRGTDNDRHASILLAFAKDMIARRDGADEASEAINEALAGLTGTVGVN